MLLTIKNIACCAMNLIFRNLGEEDDIFENTNYLQSNLDYMRIDEVLYWLFLVRKEIKRLRVLDANSLVCKKKHSVGEHLSALSELYDALYIYIIQTIPQHTLN